MIFRQLIDSDTSTYTYLLADRETHEGIIIDPVIEQVERDIGLVKDLGIELSLVIDTHVHADHVTAAAVLRSRLGCKSVLSEQAGSVAQDRLVKEGDVLRFGRHELEVRETPGHTGGCLTYVLHKEGMAFTGDALLIRGCGRTDFQVGDSATLFSSVRGKILSLPPETLLYPGHDYKGRTVTTVEEELRLNPRLGSARTSDEFVEIMANLKLAHPRRMDVAVPANLRGGAAADSPSADAPPIDCSWGPIEKSPAGVPEISSQDLSKRLSDVTLVDVREPDEFRGELGHVPGSQLIPLASLDTSADSLSRDKPVVVICRSGGRSGKAALALAGRGFSSVASLRGGMRAWGQCELSVEFGPPVVGGQQG